MQGICEGFRLTTAGSKFTQVEMENYNSTTAPETIALVHTQIRKEVVNGRYVVTWDKPTIVSALGAIPKPNGKIRLIHDCSRPLGAALNEYAEKDKVCFQSVKEAAGKLHTNYFMAKIDLRGSLSVGGHSPG